MEYGILIIGFKVIRTFQSLYTIINNKKNIITMGNEEWAPKAKNKKIIGYFLFLNIFSLLQLENISKLFFM